MLNNVKEFGGMKDNVYICSVKKIKVMITEDYVTFETAKLLKEKGFDADIITYRDYFIQDGKIVVFLQETISKDRVKTPTIQMAMKWLREVHNLFIQITVDFSDGAYPMYDICVVNLAICTSIVVNRYNRYSYEEAVETALKYSLENLI